MSIHLGPDYSPERLVEQLTKEQIKELLEFLTKNYGSKAQA